MKIKAMVNSVLCLLEWSGLFEQMTVSIQAAISNCHAVPHGYVLRAHGAHLAAPH